MELDEAFFRLVLPLLGDQARAALADPRVSLRFADPRRALEEDPARYDLMLVAMPEPTSAATSRYYSREFFQLAASRLAEGGVLALRLPAAENLWTPDLVRRTASVQRALASAFPDVLALPGSRLLLLASRQRLERDPEVLAARLRERATSPRAATPEYLRFLYTNDRKAEVAALLAASDALPNADLEPVCFRHAALLWLARVSPGLARSLEPVREGGRAPWVAFALLLVALVACRFVPRARRAGLAAFAGFSGMVLEGGLLLGYQARRGVLFEDLGLLLTVFMAGLALGARLGERAGSRWPVVLGLPAGLAALSVAVAGLARAGLALGLLSTSALLLVTGGLCGALFSLAARDGEAAGARGLYAADLAGGCLGAATASLLFFPLAGLPATSLMLAPLALAAALLAP